MSGPSATIGADRWLSDARSFEPAWSVTLDDWVTAVAVSPDGTLVAAASSAGEIVVVDPSTGTRRWSAEGAHPGGVGPLAWAPDGSRLASGGQDGAVRLWTAGGAAAGQMEGRGWVQCLAWSATGRLAAGIGRQVVVSDVIVPAAVVPVAVVPAAMGPAAMGTGAIVTGAIVTDGTVSGPSVSLEASRHDEATSTVTALAWSGDGRRLAAASYGGVWWYEPDAGTGAAHKHFAWKGSVLTVAIGPGDRWMVGGGQDATVHVWKLWSGADWEMSGFPSKVDLLSWHHGGRWLMAACTGMLTRWDFKGKGPAGRRAEVFETNKTQVRALAYEPGGDRVATLLEERVEERQSGALVLWEPGRSRRPSFGFPLGDRAGAMAWLPDRPALVVGTGSGRLALVTLF